MSSKYKRKGRNKFVMLEYWLLESTAWRSLGANERALYIELKLRYDGHNNGMIGLGCREAAEAIGVGSKDTANRAFRGLETKGFISKKKASGFNVKGRIATEWRLTEYRCDVSGELATKEFMKWGKEKSTVR